MKTKLNALERIDKGEMVKKIAAQLRLGKTAVKEWSKIIRLLQSVLISHQDSASGYDLWKKR